MKSLSDTLTDGCFIQVDLEWLRILAVDDTNAEVGNEEIFVFAIDEDLGEDVQYTFDEIDEIHKQGKLRVYELVRSL